jgi:hypothetical protein
VLDFDAAASDIAITPLSPLIFHYYAIGHYFAAIFDSAIFIFAIIFAATLMPFFRH